VFFCPKNLNGKINLYSCPFFNLKITSAPPIIGRHSTNFSTLESIEFFLSSLFRTLSLLPLILFSPSLLSSQAFLTLAVSEEKRLEVLSGC
jgi:hypothetical protein